MNTALDILTASNVLLFFGVASGVLSTFAYIPYIIDTVAGRTQPQRASWLIWSVLGSIAFFSQIYEGATSSLWFAGVQITGTIIVFVLSIWVGTGNFLSKIDYSILLAAAIGLVLWYFTETAAYALAITISISLLGGVATVTKAYRDPDSETLLTWVVSLIASVCAILSVGAFSPIILAYPLYLFTLYLAFVVAILLGRARNRVADASEPHTISSNQLSNAPFLSVLRIGADITIVGAAVLFTINWFNSNSVSQNIIRHEAPDNNENDYAATTSENMMAAEKLTPLHRKTNATTYAAASSESSPDLETPDTAIIVVTLNTREGKPSQFRTLTTDDPAFEDFVKKLDIWLAKHNYGIERQHDVALFTTSAKYNGPTPDAGTIVKQRPLPLFSGDRLELAAFTVPKASTVRFDTQAFIERPHINEASFQYLDSSDPFAKLTVTSENTRLTKPNHENSGFGNILVRGSNLIAIATNGEWFNVKTLSGETGYVHRQRVAVDALALRRLQK